ncbi:hypothetical protein JTB14_005349 [Gonioctena quinquepunctata]|nr:hypothetical protein JTB14_005349 [Gonioctena quinquepunctata]
MNYIKLLIFSVLFGIILTQNAEGEEVFLVGNKRCITNGSSALTFIKNIHDTAVDDNKVSSFFPEKNTLCNFERKDDCSRSHSWIMPNWSIKSSIGGPINQIVTDRRWEGFLLHKSKRSGENLIFHPILYLENPTNFVIPLSVRIEKDAHIYLCDGESASESNCYWIMLGSHKGTQSGIRKCREKEVPSQIKSFPNSPCNIVNGLTKVKTALKENTWAHFKISRRETKLEIFQADSDIIFISYEDGESTIFPTNHMIINSRDNAGLWKFHDYDYLYSETESEINERIGPSIPDNEWCISMFVVMCKSCKLTVRLEYFKSGHIVDYMERNFETQPGKCLKTDGTERH